MPKLVIALFIFAIGMVVWALQPASEKASPSPQASTAAPQDPSNAQLGSPGATQNRRIAKDRVRKTAKKDATRIPRRPHAELVRERDEFLKSSEASIAHKRAVPAGAKVNRPWPVYLPNEVDRDYDKYPEPNYVRPEEENPFPAVATKSFKDSVRKFYGGLPASGVVQGRVMAADVLPHGIVMGLKVPPNSELKMLGPFNMDHEKVFSNALEAPDYGEVIFGVSYQTPGGEYHRKYIRLEGGTPP